MGIPRLRLLYAWTLLGLVSSHWELPASLRNDMDLDAHWLDEEEGESNRVTVNAGMALVVPGQHILDLLNRDDVARDRERRRARERNSSEPTATHARR